MAGDPDNASMWDDADVFVSFDLEAANPADIDSDFPAEWELVGLLDGAAGFAETVDEPRTTGRAWGQGVIKTNYKGAEVTRKFTALEDNAITERLARPNLREKVLIAFETREGDKVTRKIAREPATVRRAGDSTANEDNLAMIPFQADIFPDTTIDPADEDQFWVTQTTDPLSS
jgi:hypothetical protein